VKKSSVSQAWIELRTDDPEAVSALAVARARLPAGAKLSSLRRLRLIELEGALPSRAIQESLLHRSTRFYNPAKEGCVLRTKKAEAAPLEAHEHAVLVWERGGERRAAAERWWLHETGSAIEVREGVAWVLAFEEPKRSAERAAELARLTDRRHGLFCNPHAQESRLATAGIPLPWLEREGTPRGRP